MYLSIALQPPRDRSCFIIRRATIGPVNMARLGCVLVGESKRTPFHRSAPGIVIPISAASEVECLQLKQLWSLGPIPIKMHKKVWYQALPLAQRLPTKTVSASLRDDGGKKSVHLSHCSGMHFLAILCDPPFDGIMLCAPAITSQ